MAWVEEGWGGAAPLSLPPGLRATGSSLVKNHVAELTYFSCLPTEG